MHSGPNATDSTACDHSHDAATAAAGAACCSTDSSVEATTVELSTPAQRSVYLETFGCQMNVLDSELVKSSLQAMGYRFTDDWKSADVVLYNTCSVREHAEHKVHSRIGEVSKHKREQRPDIVLGILGCMAEREGKDLVKQHPLVDLLCGPGELDKVPMLIDNTLKTQPATRRMGSVAEVALQGNTHRRSGTLAAAEDNLELLDLSRSFSPEDGKRSAYVRITRGCNKYCTYCVVPSTRGAEVHRPPNHIVDEVKKLVDQGVIEVTLLGQTVNHYHYNHGAAITINGVQQPQVGAVVGPAGPKNNDPANTTTFAQLLARIHDEVPALQRLRFVTSFPRDFGDDILQTMADRPRICRYLHLPVQSGSNGMLKLMNRGYEVEEYFELLDRVYHYLPDVQIASDLICGFPTETEEDHQATIALLERARFKNCFIFKYSPRPGTAAIDRFEDDVPDSEKRRRNNELLAVQSRISGEIHEAQVGKTVRVYVESLSNKEKKAQNLGNGQNITLGWQKPTIQLAGRTDGDLIVIFEGSADLVGQIVDVKIERAMPLTLFGQLAAAPTPA